MALITATLVTSVGVIAAPAAVSASDTLDVSNGRTWLEVVNASGGSINVTITVPYTVDALTIGPRVVAVAAGVTKKIYIPPLYGPIATIAYSATATITAAAYSV